ncbi:MAG: bifunctional (p)ppGpp synthetase/guanosine-3',5'-bis(diphosphate) 3'-pyrophosphohydrolase [Candidatus Moranbacteria bacterium]|nr:bifunctional (p)ppGpp synthetase/guanosine-3',5'-bis(diphosphate) 3'-pyrophosphohydrolase [Candidatus Moranbacteria bacterium]
MEKITLEDILKALRNPPTEARKEVIAKAYNFAIEAHKGQKRRSGEDYVTHPFAVAKILAQIGMGGKTIAAGLLHDVPEDTAITLADVEKKFGSEIAAMVDGVTKLGKIKLRGSHEEYFLENLRKMILAMASDIRVVIIKLADRLHNMQTLDFNPADKQLRIARETMEVFAPIANRLGMGEIKVQLQDLSFKYLDPENFTLVKDLAEKNYKEREKYVNIAIAELEEEMKKEGVQFIKTDGRAKSIYSLFLKMQKHEMDIDRIYDLAAIRVIVPEVADCYETLGIVHKKYRPMIGRIKDYISLPKPNGYQSIHTTVFGPDGKILEVQIRTVKMDNEAEFGIAAHWIYSENKKKKNWRELLFKKKAPQPEKELEWVKQLREWQNEIGRDDEEFVQGLRIDFFKNHIFAFTPQGDIIDLPEESTPIDFAYAIHSEVGNHATGAKADGKMVPLDYQIRNGQVLEILTSKDRKLPNADWLKFVKTAVAKTHIKRELKKDTLSK